jgi:L-gulono-1,4-lactone dehydrogenase
MIFPATWSNWLSDLGISCSRAAPANKNELLELVKFAASTGRRLRAVGSGHSHSVAARPRDIYVDMSAISGASTTAWLKGSLPGVAADEMVVRVLAGTRIKTLNRLVLPEQHPAAGMINMGAFDAQTLAGAVNTSTHGTGITLGSLADMVLSVDMVTVTRNSDGKPEVQMRRFEPTDGITDRKAFDAAYAQHGTVLEQDDDLFHSVVVGYGCLGIAYAYILKVRHEYWLQEVSQIIEWPTLRSSLDGATSDQPGVGVVPAALMVDRHFSFLLNVAEMQGKNATTRPACLVQRRNFAGMEDPPHSNLRDWPPPRRTTYLRDFFLSIYPDPQPQDEHHSLGATVRNKYFESLAGKPAFIGNRFSTASYVALRRDRDATPPEDAPEPEGEALSVEVAIPVGEVARAIDAAIDVVQRSRFFFALPIGVRFTAPSKHFMSPAYERATAFVEVAMLKTKAKLDGDKIDADQMIDRIAKPELAKVEHELCYRGKLAGRPHLGKHNTLTRALAEQLFPRFKDWVQVYARFNAFGTFDNQFTDQLGLTGEQPLPDTKEKKSWLEAVLNVMMSPAP